MEMRIHGLESVQDVLGSCQVQFESRLAVIEPAVPALREVTETHTADINNLTRTSNERFAGHKRQLDDLTARHDTLDGTVSENTSAIQKICSTLSSSTDKTVELEKHGEAKVKKQQTQFLNHTSNTTKKIEKVDGKHDAYKTIMEASLNVIRTGNIPEFRTDLTNIDTTVKDLQAHKAKVNKELDERMPEAFITVQATIKKNDELAKTTKTEVQQLLATETEARKQTDAASEAELKSSAEAQNKRLDKIKVDLTAQGVKIKSCEDSQAAVSKKLDAKYAHFDERMNRNSRLVCEELTSLKQETGCMKAKHGVYDDRLNHITKDQLDFQVTANQRMSKLEISQEVASSDLSTLRSSLQMVRESLDAANTQATNHQSLTNGTTSKHTLEITGLHARVSTLEENEASKLVSTSPSPQTPSALLAVESSIVELLKDVTRLKKCTNNHENGLLNHNETIKGHKLWITKLKEEVKQVTSTNEALSQKIAEMEAQRIKDEEKRKSEREQDDKHDTEVQSTMQEMRKEIDELKTGRQSSVSAKNFDRMEQRVDDLRCEAETGIGRLDRLVDRDAAAVSKLRSKVDTVAGENDQAFRKLFTWVRDLEDRFQTAVDTIEARCGAAFEKRSTTIRTDVDAKLKELSNNISKTIDTRSNEKATKASAAVQKLVEKERERIDNLEAAQKRAKKGSSITQAVEAEGQAPVVDIDAIKTTLQNDIATSMQGLSGQVEAVEAAQASLVPVADTDKLDTICTEVRAVSERVKALEETAQARRATGAIDDFDTFRNEYQTTTQAFVQRVDAIEASQKSSRGPPPTEAIKSLRYDLDTLTQKHQTKAADLQNLRRNFENLTKPGGSLATKAYVANKSRVVKSDIEGKIVDNFERASTTCLDRMEAVKYNVQSTFESVDEVENQYHEVSYFPTIQQ